MPRPLDWNSSNPSRPNYDERFRKSVDIVVMHLDLADLSFVDELMSKYVLYLVGFALLSQISLRLASHM